MGLVAEMVYVVLVLWKPRSFVVIMRKTTYTHAMPHIIKKKESVAVSNLCENNDIKLSVLAVKIGFRPAE